MGCTPSKNDRESIAAANLKVMQTNEAKGLERMGHDKDVPKMLLYETKAPPKDKSFQAAPAFSACI
jgi:hypothetical protein